jgi:2-polyprenyl-6-methoxyphenol hydroxylase-like FAD-dependent oxidoreductase
MGTHDVVVIGAGPVAWAAARGLAQQGLGVAVVGPLASGGRWNALLPRAERFFHTLGLALDGPEVGGMPIEGLHSVEGGTHTRFAAADGGALAMGVAVDTGALAQALASGWAHTHHTQPAVRPKREGGRWTVALADGSSVEGRFLVVADGANGPVGRALGGPWMGPPSCQGAVAWIARHTAPHGGWAFETSNDRGPVATTPLPDGPDGEHRSAVVWVDQQKRPTLTDPAVAAQAMETLLGLHLGSVKVQGPLHGWPVRFATRRRWGEGWVALGEAARLWPPTGAQGANQGLFAAERLVAHAATLATRPGLLRWVAETETVGLARLGAVGALHTALSLPIAPLRRGALGALGRWDGLRSTLVRAGLA